MRYHNSSFQLLIHAQERALLVDAASIHGVNRVRLLGRMIELLKDRRPTPACDQTSAQPALDIIDLVLQPEDSRRTSAVTLISSAHIKRGLGRPYSLPAQDSARPDREVRCSDESIRNIALLEHLAWRYGVRARNLRPRTYVHSPAQ